MDLVLGLSMTPKVARWVLVDGITGEGASVDRGALDISDVEAFDAEALLEMLPADGDLHTVGLTWPEGADAAAVKVRDAVAALGGGAHVVAVPDIDATEVLARGIAEMTPYDFLVVCVVEPDAAVVATVNGQRVTAQRIDRADSDAWMDGVREVVRSARPSPDAIFVLGSEDAAPLVSALREETARPVITAAEADFALTRGAALASVRAIDIPGQPVGKPWLSRVGVLSSVLAAAVVVFVVSLSLAVGLRLTPVDEPVHHANAVNGSVPAAPPRIAEAADAHPRLAAPPVAPPVREPVPKAVPPVVAPPPAPQAPVAPVHVPPAPVPVAPAPAAPPPVPEPVYVPPVATPYVPPVAPPPRLRDRIIDKIPLINRFR